MLENVTLLNGLNRAQLTELESAAVRRNYKKGSIILGKDDTTNYLFILMSGQVNAYVEEEGKRIVVNTIGPAETFGELAMFSGEPRSANVMAIEDCEVMVFQKDDIYKLFDSSTEFCTNIIQLLAKKVNALTEDISCLAMR